MTKSKTKSKKGKNAGAAAKIARKTLGLVVRVGDALEAAVAAATPAPVVSSTTNGAPVPAASRAPAASPAPLAASPASRSSRSGSLPEGPALPDVRAIENEPGPPGDVTVAAVSKLASEGARALAAIEAYAVQHNLEAVDMPSRDTLVAALLGGMARQESELTDDQVWSLIDEQMRIHFRTLAARAIAPAGALPV